MPEINVHPHISAWLKNCLLFTSVYESHSRNTNSVCNLIFSMNKPREVFYRIACTLNDMLCLKVCNEPQLERDMKKIKEAVERKSK